MSRFTFTIYPGAMEKVKALAADYLAEVGKDVLTAAQRECPVDTGKLKSSLQATPVNKENLSMKVVSDVEYIAYVELGTRKEDPNPFLDRALRSVAR